jgi:hypothetical protein
VEIPRLRPVKDRILRDAILNRPELGSSSRKEMSPDISRREGIQREHVLPSLPFLGRDPNRICELIQESPILLFPPRREKRDGSGLGRYLPLIPDQGPSGSWSGGWDRYRDRSQIFPFGGIPIGSLPGTGLPEPERILIRAAKSFRVPRVPLAEPPRVRKDIDAPKPGRWGKWSRPLPPSSFWEVVVIISSDNIIIAALDIILY